MADLASGNKKLAHPTLILNGMNGYLVSAIKALSARKRQKARLCHMYGNIVFFHQGIQPRNVIGVLVGYKNSVYSRKLNAQIP